MVADAATVAVAYLLGSFSFGLFVARWYAQANLRESGSGNIGATNVARTLGRLPALLTLLGDTAKGCAAVLLSQAWGGSLTVTALAALAAVIGHMYPVYHRFQGGKGVATSLGVMIPLLPWPTLGAVVCLDGRYAVAALRVRRLHDGRAGRAAAGLPAG